MKKHSYSHNFCNNCGQVGHSYQYCNYPITSIGIVGFRKGITDIEYLMIRRKDTLGFIDFMRGKYPLYNELFIQNLVNEMTISEKERILEKDFQELWKDLWGDNIAPQYKNEEKNSKSKFNNLKAGIKLNGEIISLKDFIERSNTKWVEAEWGFPKGRRNTNEKDLNCAVREFNEETGIDKDLIDIVLNVQPFEEIFTGSNFKSYCHKYYLAYVKNRRYSMDNYQKTEVSALKWMTYKECLDSIRPYNLEKIEVIKNINTILEKYTLIIV